MPSQANTIYSPRIKYDDLEYLCLYLIELKHLTPPTQWKRSKIIEFLDRFSEALVQHHAKAGNLNEMTKWAQVQNGVTQFLVPREESTPNPATVELRRLLQEYNDGAKYDDTYEPDQEELDRISAIQQLNVAEDTG